METEQKLVFVLLQYKNLAQTVECVTSLADLIRGGAEVVVVDNFSSADVVDSTRKALGTVPGIHLLFRTENDGYARGNNAGYRYAREILRAAFVAIFNNDTVIEQTDFAARLHRSYTRTGAAVIGPDIRVQDGRRVLHQNPSLRPLTADEVRRRLERIRTVTVAKPSRIPGSYRRTLWRRYGIVAHGAALIFTPRFTAEFEEPFDPRTFLYEEERILFARTTARGWKTCYEPSLVVWHRTQVKDYKQSPDYMSWRAGIKAQSYQALLSVLDEISTGSSSKE